MPDESEYEDELDEEPSAEEIVDEEAKIDEEIPKIERNAVKKARGRPKKQPAQPTPKEQTRVIERVVDLGLINEKLNYLIGIIESGVAPLLEKIEKNTA